MGWQARCLLPLLLRKVDRAGCVDLDGAGAEGVAALVEIPLEVAEARAFNQQTVFSIGLLHGGCSSFLQLLCQRLYAGFHPFEARQFSA